MEAKFKPAGKKIQRKREEKSKDFPSADRAFTMA
jgi:hypothetical protein